MKKDPFIVLAECVDNRTGKRFVPGDTFEPAPGVEQAKRLVDGKCLPEAAIEAAQEVEDAGGVDGAALARDQLNNDGLFDRSDAEISEIVFGEGIDIKGAKDKASIIAAIRAHRSNPPRPDAKNVEMRTEDGERAEREADKATTDRYVDKKPAKSAK